jgi:transposase
MRGTETKQATMLSLLSPEQRVPKDHPLRRIKQLADAALRDLSPVFDEMYAAKGRPSVPPERLLKGSLLMAFYSVRSERLFCEQLDYNLMFRWFLDMSMVEDAFDHSTFSLNRERLLRHDVANKFFAAVVEQARSAGLMSDDHFTVDGTLIDAWASMKSFQRKDQDKKKPPDDPGNPSVNFRGEKRSNETHQSSTDPESELARKGPGQPSRLAYSGHALMENRHGLLVDLKIARGNESERAAALGLLESHVNGPATVAGDRGYDVASFVERCRTLGITPHVAQYEHRASAIDGRTTRHDGYRVSQRIRKRVEEIFGWLKTVANFRKTRFRGIERTQLAAHLNGAAYNLLRIAKLTAHPA